MKKSLLLLFVLILGLAACSTSTDSSEYAGEWEYEYTKTLATEASIYEYPLLKYIPVMDGYNQENLENGGPGIINAFKHNEELSPATFKGGTSMNRDTLYSFGFLDLRDGPMVVTTGESIDGRYFSVEFTDFYSDCIGYAGTRVNNNKASATLITPPGWKGVVPDGIDQVYESSTYWVFACVRTFTNNTEEDLKIANKMQDSYKVYDLDGWDSKTEATPKDGSDLPAMFDDTTESKVDFMNEWSRIVGYPESEEQMMKQYSLIGMGPLSEGSISELSEQKQAGIIDGFEQAEMILDDIAKDVGSIGNFDSEVNGWKYNPSNWGRMAEDGDYIGRAGTQAYSGGTENYIEEATKARVFNDVDGNPLDGSQTYEIVFTADNIPQVDAFWSVTLYDEEYNIYDNPDDIYITTSSDPNLVYGEDGSVKITLSPENPNDETTNWIPTPDGMDFNLFFRAYLPGESLQNQTYEIPGVEKV